MKKYRIGNLVSWLFLILMIFITGTLFFMVFIEDNPPVIVNSVTVNKTTASPGDEVFMTFDFCKFTDSSSELHAFWQRETDGLIWLLSIQNLNIADQDTCKELVVSLVIPEDIPEGNWKRVNIAEYTVNPISVRTVAWESPYIKIENK